MYIPCPLFIPVMVCYQSNMTGTTEEIRIGNYKKQYDTMYSTVQTAITNGDNVVICGPGRSGKSHLTNSLREVLQQNGYKTYYGFQHYKQCHRHLDTKFWIEELDTHRHTLSGIRHNYKYIELTLQYDPDWDDTY